MCISNTFLGGGAHAVGSRAHFEPPRPRKIDNSAFPPSSSFSFSFHGPLCPFLLPPPPPPFFLVFFPSFKHDGMSQAARAAGSSSSSVTY